MSPKVVLLVEDYGRDADLALRAFARLSNPVEVHVAVDGVEAMSFLRREPPRFIEVPRPHLVLLDLHMPRKDGKTVLREVKGDPHLRAIPVVMFTGVASTAEVHELLDLHANACVVKPVSPVDYAAAIAEIALFWLETALPL